MFRSIVDKIIGVYNLKGISNLSDLTTLQLVKKVPANGSLSEIVTYLKKMLDIQIGFLELSVLQKHWTNLLSC